MPHLCWILQKCCTSTSGRSDTHPLPFSSSPSNIDYYHQKASLFKFLCDFTSSLLEHDLLDVFDLSSFTGTTIILISSTTHVMLHGVYMLCLGIFCNNFLVFLLTIFTGVSIHFNG
uniref:Putative ovule protein n=1 Tax=Solanum chacoense TaxID=4108 RepID=A0A0V0IW45_SOLCH